MTKLKKMSLLL